MSQTALYQRRATVRDLVIMQTPRRWRHFPFLPVVRRPTEHDSPELGVLYDARAVSGITGYRCTVFLVNLFALPLSEASLLVQPRCTYDNFEELLDDGWIVD